MKLCGENTKGGLCVSHIRISVNASLATEGNLTTVQWQVHQKLLTHSTEKHDRASNAPTHEEASAAGYSDISPSLIVLVSTSVRCSIFRVLVSLSFCCIFCHHTVLTHNLGCCIVLLWIIMLAGMLAHRDGECVKCPGYTQTSGVAA